MEKRFSFFKYRFSISFDRTRGGKEHRSTSLNSLIRSKIVPIEIHRCDKRGDNLHRPTSHPLLLANRGMEKLAKKDIQAEILGRTCLGLELLFITGLIYSLNIRESCGVPPVTRERKIATTKEICILSTYN